MFMNNELFLLVTILALRLADGITSYIPAQGLIEGLTEANPIAAAMIEKWGFLWGFVAMLVISMAFVIAFLVATYLEEVRKAHKGDLRSVRRIRSVRFAGLTILAVLSSLPVLNNLILALHL
jgi:hypothetical protein